VTLVIKLSGFSCWFHQDDGELVLRNDDESCRRRSGKLAGLHLPRKGSSSVLRALLWLKSLPWRRYRQRTMAGISGGWSPTGANKSNSQRARPACLNVARNSFPALGPSGWFGVASFHPFSGGACRPTFVGQIAKARTHARDGLAARRDVFRKIISPRTRTRGPSLPRGQRRRVLFPYGKPKNLYASRVRTRGPLQWMRWVFA
jgi:hypothetical protein